MSFLYDSRRAVPDITAVTDGVSTVTFQACANRETQFAGGFIVDAGVTDFQITFSSPGSQTRTVALKF